MIPQDEGAEEMDEDTQGQYWQTLAEEGNDPDADEQPDWKALRERDEAERKAEKDPSDPAPF